LIKFSLIVDCGIFGTYRGIGLLLDDDTIEIAFKHGQNVVKPTVAMKIEQMVAEYFSMGMNKAEWQVFRHTLHNPDRKNEITITMNKHFSLT
jgi:hypothetical protein